MNVWDLILGAGIAGLVMLAVHLMHQTKRRGGCMSCPYAGECLRRSSENCEVRHG